MAHIGWDGTWHEGGEASNEVSGLVMSPLQSTLNHQPDLFFPLVNKFFSSLSENQNRQRPVSFIKDGSQLLFCWFSWLWLTNKHRWSQNRWISESLTGLDIDSECLLKWCKMRLEEIKKSGNVSSKVDIQPIANDVWAKSVLDSFCRFFCEEFLMGYLLPGLSSTNGMLWLTDRDKSKPRQH